MNDIDNPVKKDESPETPTNIQIDKWKKKNPFSFLVSDSEADS